MTAFRSVRESESAMSVNTLQGRHTGMAGCGRAACVDVVSQNQNKQDTICNKSNGGEELGKLNLSSM